MRKKRILVISTQLVGGCFQYANSIIKNLQGNIEIVLPSKGREVEDVIPDWSIKYVGYNKFIRLISLWLSLMRITCGLIFRRYNALVLFGITRWDYYYLRLWKNSKLPSFTVIHDGKMHDGEANDQFQNHIIRIMGISTHLLFLSEYTRNMVVEEFNISKPSCVIPHGLISYGSIRQQDQRSIPVLLFLGRVSKYKGVDTLLKAMQLVPKDLYAKLVVAGKWDESITVALSTDKTEVINKYLSKEQILFYLEMSDIMVFPYHEATQSGVATLAINYLKPSIVTDIGAFSEQFTNNSAVFIEPDDPVALANAITELCLDVPKRQRMVESLKQERNRFKWSSIAEGLTNYIASEIQK